MCDIPVTTPSSSSSTVKFFHCLSLVDSLLESGSTTIPLPHLGAKREESSRYRDRREPQCRALPDAASHRLFHMAREGHGLARSRHLILESTCTRPRTHGVVQSPLTVVYLCARKGRERGVWRTVPFFFCGGVGPRCKECAPARAG